MRKKNDYPIHHEEVVVHRRGVLNKPKKKVKSVITWKDGAVEVPNHDNNVLVYLKIQKELFSGFYYKDGWFREGDTGYMTEPEYVLWSEKKDVITK